MKIRVVPFSNHPTVEFNAGDLIGFDRDALDGAAYETDRARALYAALGASVEDEEYSLGELPDGRWALVGLTIPGYMFAVEEA